jgi:hypothetical protein
MLLEYEFAGFFYSILFCSNAVYKLAASKLQLQLNCREYNHILSTALF